MNQDLMTNDADTRLETPAATGESGYDLATQLVAKLCHDFISPTGAIVSGLDLLDDPSAQDMRDDALNMIRNSATKLVSLVKFARIAFGAATSAEAFSGKEIRIVLEDITASLRAKLVFEIADELILAKPAARALANLGYMAANALPTGGDAVLTSHTEGDVLFLEAVSKGPRARLKPEAVEGLAGHQLSEGLSGQWIQPYWLFSVVAEAGGTLAVECLTDEVRLTVKMPQAV
jgi:histidine phosphotransferase ChpT